MPTSYPTPSPAALAALLDNTGTVPPGTFEIGLVLGGTVSAGCYTAGVLDFIFQALEEWQAAKTAGGPDIPSHNLIIKGITGASGGGVNGAIAGQALAYGFPHVTTAQPPKTGNPFYDVWVDGIDLMSLLDTSDIDQGANSSLMNGQVLTNVG